MSSHLSALTRVAPLCLLLAGCNEDYRAHYEQEASAKPVAVATPIERGSTRDRVRVTRLSVFKDDLAYNGYRGVYLIHDEETGVDFIGVSGVGIAELGSHRSGKATHEDER